MKRLIIVIVIAALMSGNIATFAQNKERDNNIQEIEFVIPVPKSEHGILRSPARKVVSAFIHGRQGVILVESNESSQEVSLAIRAAFNAKTVNGQLSLDSKAQTILNNSEINICIIGGDGGEAAKTIEGFNAFKDFIINGGVYTNEVFGVPISFSAAYASDNSLFISQFDI